MGKNVNVISSNLDGAELRREERKNSYFTRCKGSSDDVNINEAISSCNKGKHYTTNPEAWERIFGDK